MIRFWLLFMNTQTRRRIAWAIRHCFRGVAMNRHSFTLNAEYLKSPTGEIIFYEAKDVEKVQRRLDRLIRVLWKD